MVNEVGMERRENLPDYNRVSSWRLLPPEGRGGGLKNDVDWVPPCAPLVCTVFRSRECVGMQPAKSQ